LKRKKNLIFPTDIILKIAYTGISVVFGVISVTAISMDKFGIFLLFLFFFSFFLYLAWKPEFIIIEKEVEIPKEELQTMYQDFYKKRQELEKLEAEEQANFVKEGNLIKLKIEKERHWVEKEIHKQKLNSKVTTIRINENIKRGKTELTFLSILLKYFEGNIKVDLIPDQGFNPYRPDFTFVCDNSGLHMDIEIDEPYSIDEGIPIHYIGSNDNERNAFF
jgi:hypothetical protein